MNQPTVTEIDTIDLRQLVAVTYDCQSVMEVEREWYNQYLEENPDANLAQVWEAAIDNGFEPDLEWKEPTDGDAVIDTWIGE